jgi:hypothetical protein
MTAHINLLSYLAQFFSQCEVFQTKVEKKNQNTHFMYSEFSFSFSPKITWKNIVEPGRPQIKIWRLHIACCIPKVTNTHSCNTYCFPTATMFARTGLNVTSYVQCPSYSHRSKDFSSVTVQN